MPPTERRATSFRLPVELLEAVDEARGDVSRTRFLERALERALPAKDNPSQPEKTPFVEMVENLEETPRGEVVKADSEKPARYEQQRPDLPPIPKIAKRHWSG